MTSPQRSSFVCGPRFRVLGQGIAGNGAEMSSGLRRHNQFNDCDGASVLHRKSSAAQAFFVSVDSRKPVQMDFLNGKRLFNPFFGHSSSASLQPQIVTQEPGAALSGKLRSLRRSNHFHFDRFARSSASVTTTASAKNIIAIPNTAAHSHQTQPMESPQPQAVVVAQDSTFVLPDGNSAAAMRVQARQIIAAVPFWGTA